MFRQDTIVAISTPPGRGGIGVIRLSGPRAREFASVIFDTKSDAAIDQPGRVRFGRIIDPASREPIDDALLTYFKAPHSYTGEDVIELSCHGSPVILRRVLGLLTARGARISEPGEFTLRAFLNRRMDLAQAQAVRDCINAQTEYQARVATRQLEGALSRRLTPIKDALVEVIVHLESLIEFVEDDISTVTASALSRRLEQIGESLKEIAASFSFGRFVKEGFDLAIVGRPNVGKSSVFNRLVGAERAIVTELPGTTRDTLYESTSIGGVPVRLIDTAGIRETSDLVESLGITRSRAAIADADITLLVLDASQPLARDDTDLLNHIAESQRLIALNKCDLPNRLNEGLEAAGEVVKISALTGSGFDELTARLLARLGGERGVERDDIMITDARQHAAVTQAVSDVSEARELMIQGELEEVILLKLHGALQSLGEITGETLTDDILGQIFSTFCIGK
ncbi:MAG TPA: tRNA uridine-5-carboxymethylaminomethyl(34) synthesis GTPase MnmE [Blastocatellia bacterium]|nr:tRNA uridine-5-carboxymethylaminomethyl(34) synthesis GTPase MnmE [Blastocatellia bacterium]